MERFKRSNNKKELTDSAVDANLINSVTSSLEITNQKIFALYVDPLLGSHVIHQIILQSSADNVNFYDNGALVTGCGVAGDDTMATNYVRAKVKVAEGAASTVCVTIIAE